MIDRLAQSLVFQLVLLSAVLVLWQGTGLAGDGIATFTTVSGTVDILHNGRLPAVVVKAGDSVAEGDFVRTRSGSFAEIQFRDGTTLKVAQRSRIDITAYFSGQQKNGANVRLPRGKVEAIVDPASVKQAGQGRRFEVHTPNAVAGVRGTDFIVSHDQNLTGVLVRHGSVYTYNRRLPGQVITVTAGNITTIAPGTPPQPPRQALPSEKQRMEKGVAAPRTASGSQTGQTTTQTTAGQTMQAGETQTERAEVIGEAAPAITTVAPTSSEPSPTASAIPAVVTPIPAPSVTAPPPPSSPPPIVPPTSATTNTNVNVTF